MTDQTESLNPCPFCGGKFPSMAIDKNSVDVICIQCGVMMPSCNDAADAIGRWNERAESPISGQTRKDDKDFLIDCLKTGRKIDLEDYNFHHTTEIQRREILDIDKVRASISIAGDYDIGVKDGKIEIIMIRPHGTIPERSSEIPLNADGFQCGTCGDKNVPEKYRVFGSCYVCAAKKSITKRNDKIDKLTMRESVALTDEDKKEIVSLMVARAQAMGEISLQHSMGNAFSALLTDPRYEIRRRS